MSNGIVFLLVLAMLFLTYNWGGWDSLRDCLMGLGVAHVLIMFLRIL
jgi:hypothetical protein